MRIAVISRVFSRAGGGAESYSVSLVQQLAGRHDVHVFAQESNQPVPGVHYHRVLCLSRKPRWINQLVFAVVTWWRTRTGFDVVHSHENTWHGQIQTVHVRPTRYNLFHGRRGLRLGMRWLKVLLSPRLMTYVWLEGARFARQPGRHVVATSDTLYDECAQAYPLAELSVITPGTDMPSHAMSPAQARAQLQLPLQARCLLFVANDYARKGLDTLLQALAKLPEAVHLTVVGNPGLIPRYQALARQFGVSQRVHFVGRLDDTSVAYRSADCLVHPTLEDSFAMVVLEAMAHGLPVIVSGPSYCGISRQLQHMQQAWLLENPRDAQTLSLAVREVLDTPQLADSLGNQGRAFARAHSWERAALQYERLYGQAAGLER